MFTCYGKLEYSAEDVQPIHHFLFVRGIHEMVQLHDYHEFPPHFIALCAHDDHVQVLFRRKKKSVCFLKMARVVDRVAKEFNVSPTAVEECLADIPFSAVQQDVMHRVRSALTNDSIRVGDTHHILDGGDVERITTLVGDSVDLAWFGALCAENRRLREEVASHSFSVWNYARWMLSLTPFRPIKSEEEAEDEEEEVEEEEEEEEEAGVSDDDRIAYLEEENSSLRSQLKQCSGQPVPT
jgi:hypothetical protein